MKHTCWLLGLIGLFIFFSGAASDPAVLEQKFIAFKPVTPLELGSLNLYGYETEKAVQSTPILSPDKTQMAVSEVLFIPDLRQTISQIRIYPVGPLPKVQDEKNPQPFWDRYIPDKQAAKAVTLFDQGFERTQSYRVDILQVADWSLDGRRLLCIYRPGIHHLGIYKTIPVLYNMETRDGSRLTSLPQGVWDNFKIQQPQVAQQIKVWDIRPLGWDIQSPSAILIQLVIFKDDHQLSAGFWSYDTMAGILQNLGDQISPDRIAHNGYVVKFMNPSAGTNDAKRNNRIRFWKKPDPNAP